MSIHTGKIPLDEISEQTTTYLDGFDQIVVLYLRWSAQRVQEGSLAKALNRVPERHKAHIMGGFQYFDPTVYQAYNAATDYATHRTYSYRVAFDLLERINRGFQETFSASRN